MDYLARFCSKLSEDSTELLKKSKDICQLCRDNAILSQNTPVSIAAASIYMATTILDMESEIPRADIAKVANTSQVTIGKCYKKENRLIKSARRLIGTSKYFELGIVVFLALGGTSLFLNQEAQNSHPKMNSQSSL